MFVKLGREFVWSQFKETLEIDLVLFVKNYTIKEWKKFNRESGAELEPNNMDEVFTDGWISTTQMRELYVQLILKEELLFVAINQTIEDPVGLRSTGIG